MRTAMTFLAVVCFYLAIPEALATNNVVSVDSLDSIRLGGGAGTNAVDARGYAQPNDGGGGLFVKKNGSCTDDDGVVINDGSNCWYRQFSGPVDIRWYGLSASITQDILTQFSKAFDAANQFGNGSVVTAGQAIALPPSGDLDIPDGETLDCQGTIGGLSGDGWTVPTLYASIILTPPFEVRANSRSALKNCNIRPSWFTGETPTETIRDLINILRQFSGTGVECVDDGCSIQNVAVYGFDTGIRADKSQRFYMNNVVVDSNVGVWWRAMAGASKNTNLLVDPVITQGSGNSEEDWSVTGVSADTNGECKLTLSTSPDDLRTDADTGTGGSDTIWVYGIGATVAIDTTGTRFSGSDTRRTKKPLGLLPTQV